MLAQKLYPCPCCGFETLSNEITWDVCMLCYWEDDGQNDADADEPNYGPNGDLSLTDARANFLDHGHMYSLEDGANIFALRYPTKERLDWVKYALAVRKGEEALDKTLFESLRIADEITREID